MSNGRKIKKDKTAVKRKKGTPIKKKKITAKNSTIQTWNEGKKKIMGASGSLGLIVGGSGKILKLAGGIVKSLIKKKLLGKTK